VDRRGVTAHQVVAERIHSDEEATTESTPADPATETDEVVRHVLLRRYPGLFSGAESILNSSLSLLSPMAVEHRRIFRLRSW
jgi:hypothetical protein